MDLNVSDFDPTTVSFSCSCVDFNKRTFSVRGNIFNVTVPPHAFGSGQDFSGHAPVVLATHFVLPEPLYRA